jgi:hypothetical protein
MSRDRRGNIKNVRHLGTGSSLLGWPNRKPHHAFGGVSLRAAAPVTAIESVAVAKMRKSPSDCQVRALTRCLESTAAIVATKSLVAGVPQWLRACRDRASAHSGCRAERLIPAHHHAFGNAFFRLPPETRRACPTAFWPHCARSTASGRYYVDDRPSSFRLRRNGIGEIVDLAGAQPALSRMLRGGYNKDARCPR